MAEGPRIVFDGIWKKFRRGEVHDSLRDLIPTLVKNLAHSRDKRELGTRDFWALRDVSFEVHAGHALGIIGRNGAGKSTTLKILTRIIGTTRGTYMTKGRVGALIEVAAGFHPDLTGRENVFLQAAILGIPRNVTDRVFDSIVDFAGVEAFIDTPVKRYSSGMNARLGFAVAAHIEPDVLIIDEVLSVGDMAFQAKCIERMHAFKRDGVAIVFVSHNMQAISQLCDDALHLDGEVVRQGPAADVISAYVTGLAQGTESSADAPVRIGLASFGRADGQPADIVAPRTRLRQSVTIDARDGFEDAVVWMIVRRSTDGLRVFDRSFSAEELGVGIAGAGMRCTLDTEFSVNLARGLYHIEWNVYHAPTGRFLASLSPATIFRVDEYQSQNGVADLDLQLIGAESALITAGD
jgi:lipopolysaccharide transport system ATP-binding protein